MHIGPARWIAYSNKVLHPSHNVLKNNFQNSACKDGEGGVFRQGGTLVLQTLRGQEEHRTDSVLFRLRIWPSRAWGTEQGWGKGVAREASPSHPDVNAYRPKFFVIFHPGLWWQKNLPFPHQAAARGR